jgi:hypothetical protein
MAFTTSTGLRNHMLVTGSVKSGLDGGVIRVYDGVVPASADAALSGNTLLVTISNGGLGTGITLDATPSAGVVVKNTSETWSGTCSASGTATFFRFSAITDAFGSSTTEKRAQGTVGVLGADMLVANTTFTNGAVRQVDSFALGMPSA